MNELELLAKLNTLTKEQRRALFNETRTRRAKRMLKDKRKTLVFWSPTKGTSREASRVHGTNTWLVRDPSENHRVMYWRSTSALAEEIGTGVGEFYTL